MDYQSAVELVLQQLDAGNVETAWSDALVTSQGDVKPVVLATQEGMILEQRQMIISNPRSLGNGETGSQAALAMWMPYMATALKGVPEGGFVPPDGIVAARINPSTGLRDPSSSTIDFFFAEHLPSGAAEQAEAQAVPASKSPLQAIRDLLF